ncbi:MAG: hypothetical protein ACP5N7_06340 [Candidatus Pacearchaeota archaeon]
MNRRAHVGTVLLVIGAFLLVIASLFMMVSSNTDLSLIKAELRSSSDFAHVSHEYLLDSTNSIIVKAVSESKDSLEFEKSFNESLKKYANEKRASGLNTNLYAKLSLGDYSVVFKDGKYELLVTGIFENYNFKGNEIGYSYSLNVVFDRAGFISMKESLYKVD